MRIIFISSIVFICNFLTMVQAKSLWQESRVTYLKGQNYLIGDQVRDVFTFEHAMSASWGDSFMFLDHMRSESGHSNYAEWSPRFSACKLAKFCTDKDAFISEVYVATTVEMSSASTHFLYGIGTNLNLPYFSFFQLNLYKRNNEAKANNWQITTAWLVPFTISNQKFVYDGFMDFFNKTDDQSHSRNITSQLKWQASELLNTQDKVYIGIEYVYWKNKFGIASTKKLKTNESNINLLVKWHF